MTKVENEPEANEKEAPKQDATAGSAAPSANQKLAEEADAFCADLERFFRRAFGEVPKAVELGEIRAQQATVRNLVHRASAAGSESSAKVAELSAEREKYKDAAARARADFLNYQARSGKDLERAEELSLRGYVSELLPILDSMNMTLQDSANANEKADFSRLKQALEMINSSMQQVLAVRGLERIPAKGMLFDPVVHEAVAKRPADPSKGEQPNTVLEELRPGYKWKGLLLRPAQVLISAQ